MATKQQAPTAPAEQKAPDAASAAPETTSLAEVEAKNTLPMAVADMEGDAGGGFEEATKASYAIPFIQILQKGSPSIDPDHPKHKEIPGAKIGAFLNTVTEEIVDGEKGLVVLPCHFQQYYIEWADQDKGGGFIAQHDVPTGVNMLATTVRDDKGHDLLPNGNYLVDTRNHYVLVIREDEIAYPAVISMSSTQTKKSKKWMSAMQDAKEKRGDGSLFTPPMWARSYRVKTIGESNSKGTWRGWDITLVKGADDKAVTTPANLYMQAKAFRDAVRGGKIRTVDPAAEGTAGSGDDIPF